METQLYTELRQLNARNEFLLQNYERRGALDEGGISRTHKAVAVRPLLAVAVRDGRRTAAAGRGDGGIADPEMHALRHREHPRPDARARARARDLRRTAIVPCERVAMCELVATVAARPPVVVVDRRPARQ